VYRRTDDKKEIIKKAASTNFDLSIEEIKKNRKFTINILQQYCLDNKIYFTTKMKRDELIEQIQKYREKGKKKEQLSKRR